MFCRNCGSQVRDGAAFCPNCGAQVSAPTGFAAQPAGFAARPTYAGAAGFSRTAYAAARPHAAASRKVAAGIIVAAAVVAAVVLVLVLHVGGIGDPGELEAADLAQMSSAEAGEALEGLYEARIDGAAYDRDYVWYATSEEIADTIKGLVGWAPALRKDTRGSVFQASDDYNGNSLDSAEVSDGKAAVFMQMRYADDVPDVDALKTIAKDLGAEHVLILVNNGYDPYGDRIQWMLSGISYGVGYTLPDGKAGLFWYTDDDYLVGDYRIDLVGDRSVWEIGEVCEAFEYIESHGLEETADHYGVNVEDVLYYE